MAEADQWKHDAEPVIASMREMATAELEREKEQGKRKKMITDADVTAKCAILYPDEWEAQRKKLKDAEHLIKTMTNLVDLTSSKCRNNAVILGKMRS